MILVILVNCMLINFILVEGQQLLGESLTSTKSSGPVTSFFEDFLPIFNHDGATATQAQAQTKMQTRTHPIKPHLYHPTSFEIVTNHKHNRNNYENSVENQENTQDYQNTPKYYPGIVYIPTYFPSNGQYPKAEEPYYVQHSNENLERVNAAQKEFSDEENSPRSHVLVDEDTGSGTKASVEGEREDEEEEDEIEDNQPPILRSTSVEYSEPEAEKVYVETDNESAEKSGQISKENLQTPLRYYHVPQNYYTAAKIQKNKNEHEEYGSNGFKKFSSGHHHDNANKGRHGSSQEKGHHGELGHNDKGYHDYEGHYKNHHEDGKRYKGAKFGEKKGHKKGHKTKGYHNKFFKDEYHKEHKFYDDYHKNGHFKKYGDHRAKYFNEEGGMKKGGKELGHQYEKSHGRKGHYAKGHHDHDDKGFNKKLIGNKFHKNYENYGKTGGRNSGKTFGYRYK